MIRDSAASEFNWASLGQVNPLALAPARNLAHHALQWASLAARAAPWSARPCSIGQGV